MIKQSSHQLDNHLLFQSYPEHIYEAFRHDFFQIYLDWQVYNLRFQLLELHTQILCGHNL